jgi:diguanylate cyclase (GGDEF)-like protein
MLAPLRVRAIARDGAFGFRFDGQRDQSVRVIGYLDLGIDAGYYHQEFMRSVLLGSGLIAALLLLALLAGRWLVRRWLAPLTELRVPLERLARGDTSVTVARHTGHAEIEAIGAAVQQLQRLADHDLLTGLPNRGCFMRWLEQERRRLQESGGRSALYFIDLDQFKYINDTLGHGAGDQLLAQVAQALRRRLRVSDLIARFGGDEFVVLAHDVTAAQALELAAGINHAVNEARIVERGTVCSTGASVGIALLGGEPYTVEELLAQADMACYAAKAFGRNGYRLYEPQDAERLRMGADFRQSQLLKTALRDGLLRLHYQPMIGLRRGERTYYEALLRMPGKDTELVLPEVFLPAAQRFGLLAEIDRWVIENALGSLAGARRQGRDIGISINLSGHSFADPALYEFIRERLAHNGLAGGEVMFEVTEQTAVRNLERADPLMRGLLDCGCHIALDDFGAGFSSFGYLRHLPVDFVKIDGAFVRNMAADRLDQAMVRAIVDVAHTLEKRTVAEYVQDGRTVELLRGSGVDFVQGHYIGRPSQELAPPTPAPARPAGSGI